LAQGFTVAGRCVGRSFAHRSAEWHYKHRVGQESRLADDTILDPFCGSGTTLAASMIAGRRGLGCDISRDYFKTAKQRLIELEVVTRG